jgi:YceI-like domain
MPRHTTAAPGSAAIGTAALFCLVALGRVHAQSVHFTIEDRESLAWWQMNPHLNHLWATTCPEDPSWQPGEDRGSGWSVKTSKLPSTRHSNTLEKKIPLYPRQDVSAVCPRDAVSGGVVASDTAAWRGSVRGNVSVRASTLITGLRMRDSFASRTVLQSQKYPDIRFRIDSLTPVQTGAGDTLRADAVGILELRGVETPLTVPIKAWREGNGMRVTGQFQMRPAELVEKYGVSRFALGLGIGTGIWKELHMGLDVILRPASSSPQSRQ